MSKKYDCYDISATIIPLYFFIEYYHSNKYEVNYITEFFFLFLYGFSIYCISEITHHRCELKLENKKLENIKSFLQTKTLIFENHLDLKNYLRSCPICFTVLNRTKKKIVLTKCNHIYCHKCWVEWSQENNECPLCRMPIFFD